MDFAGRHAELGFTEIVIHWPIPDSDFAADEKVFERIAMEAPAQLALRAPRSVAAGAARPLVGARAGR